MSQKKIINIVIAIILIAICILVGTLIYKNGVKREKIDVVFIEKSLAPGFEFWELVSKGAMEGAKEFNVNLEIKGTMSEEDVEGQVRLINEAIDQAPDVIVLAPVDENCVVEAARRGVDNNIKLILVDSTINENLEECFVGTDNYAAAKFLGEEMGKTINNKGNIAIVHHQKGTSTATQRINGFKEGIGEYKGIEILGEFDVGDSVEKSYEITKEILKNNPSIIGIYATNQISAEGVTKALFESEQRPIFYAFDSSTVQNDALEKGIINGFAVQKPFDMGYMGIKSGVEAYKGTLKNSNIDTGFSFVTKENMNQEEIQKLIYPFV